MNLQMKVQLPIALLIILMSGISGYISYQESAESLQSAIVDNMSGEAEGLVRAVASMTRGVSVDAERVAQRSDVLAFYGKDIHDKAVGESFTGELQHIEKTYPDFDRLTLLDDKGIAVASSQAGSIGQSFSDRTYFQEAIKGRTFLSPPFVSRVNQGKVVMAAAAPVKREGKVVGVAYCVMILDHLNDASVKPVSVGRTGYAFVLGPDGLIAIHKNPEWIANGSLKSTPYYKEMVNATASGMKDFIGDAGVRVVSYYAKDAFSGLTAVVQADYDDVFEGLADMRRKAVIVGIVSVLVGNLVVFFVLRPMLKAINQGMVFAGRVAAGDLSGTLSVKRTDELGKLAEALRSIPDSLRQVIAEYRNLEKSIESGRLDATGDPSHFSGEFANLIQGTNAVLQRFRVIVDHIPSPTVTLSSDLKLLYMNAVARQLTTDDYKGKTGDTLFRPDDYSDPESALRRALATKKVCTSETRAHPNGRDVDISYTTIPMQDAAGNITFVLQLITDLTRIKSVQRTIMDVAGQAMDISNRVASASEELSSQVAHVNQGMEVQRERVDSTVTAMEEMNATVLEVARNSGQANEQADATRDKANYGAELVDKVVAAIRQVNNVAMELQTNMEELGSQAKAIGGVMNVISDIADQTNLLALNAAIEAARAGDAGRGFAVVADEVRKLAEKTMSATSEVGASIQGIQNSAASNIQRVGEAARSAGEATDLAGTSGEALHEIVQLAGRTSALIAAIATAAEEQSSTSEEINRAVEEINVIAGETSSGMEQSSAAVRELSRMAQELKLLLDKLRG